MEDLSITKQRFVAHIPVDEKDIEKHLQKEIDFIDSIWSQDFIKAWQRTVDEKFMSYCLGATVKLCAKHNQIMKVHAVTQVGTWFLCPEPKCFYSCLVAS